MADLVQMFDSTITRAHVSAGEKGVGWPGARQIARGLYDQNPFEDRLDGYPIAFDLTGGEKGDAPHFPLLLDLGPDIRAKPAIADKGYASKATRNLARSRGIIPVIPHKSNEK
jgi:transposase